MCIESDTVKLVHTGMPWGQTFIPVWTGSGLERVFAFGEEQTTITVYTEYGVRSSISARSLKLSDVAPGS